MKVPEMDLLLSKYLDHEATEAEGRAVEERLRTDPACALQFEQMKALGMVLDMAVEMLKPEESLLANIMGRITAEAAVRRKSSITIPTPSRILEIPAKQRLLSARWLRAAIAAAAVVALVVGVVMIAFGPSEKPQSITVAAKQALGDVQVVSAKSKAARPFGKSEALFAGDTIKVGGGKVDMETENWNCRLNNNTSLTYLETKDGSLVLDMKEGEIWVNNTSPAPANRLQVKTSFGTILASDATFDVKVEKVKLPVLVSNKGESEGLAVGEGFWSDAGACVMAARPVFCGEKEQPAQSPAEQQQKYIPQGNQKLEFATQDVTRITVIVSRGAIAYMRGGQRQTIDVNGVLQYDTRPNREPITGHLTEKTVRGLLGWWESGSVETPDVEFMRIIEGNLPYERVPDNNGKDVNPPSEKNSPPKGGKGGEPVALQPDEILLKIDSIENGALVHCTLQALVFKGAERITCYSRPVIGVGGAIGGVETVGIGGGKGSEETINVDFATGAKIISVTPVQQEPNAKPPAKQEQAPKGEPPNDAGKMSVNQKRQAQSHLQAQGTSVADAQQAKQAGNQDAQADEFVVTVGKSDGSTVTLRVGESCQLVGPGGP
jgi:hypothetical protein